MDSNEEQKETAPEQAAEQYVVARRYRDLPDAALAKSMLDSAGIECVLGDEATVRMDWLWSNAVGGVKVWVKEKDLAEAKALLGSDEIPGTTPTNA